MIISGLTVAKLSHELRTKITDKFKLPSSHRLALGVTMTFVKFEILVVYFIFGGFSTDRGIPPGQLGQTNVHDRGFFVTVCD